MGIRLIESSDALNNKQVMVNQFGEVGFIILK